MGVALGFVVDEGGSGVGLDVAVGVVVGVAVDVSVGRGVGSDVDVEVGATVAVGGANRDSGVWVGGRWVGVGEGGGVAVQSG